MAAGREVYTFDKAGTVTQYTHPDHLHSSTVIADSNGVLLQHYEYGAFGNQRYQFSTTAFPVSKRYTSKVLDEDTGLYYYGARYYDPELGRFVQPDSIIPDFGDPQSWNRYSYCLNNPLKYTDPTGHETYFEGVGNVFLGYYDAGAGLVGGTIHMVAHPVQTAQGIGTAIAHPIRTGDAIVNSTVETWNSGTRGQGEVVGSVLLAIGSALAPAAEAANVSKAAEIGKVAGAIEKSGSMASEGGLRIVVNPNTGELGGVNISGVNGNSLASKKLQHGYEVFKTSDGDVVKTGVSGQPLRKSGASPRATPQVNKWNRAEGPGTYDARVVTQQPDRQAVIQWERQNAARLRQAGNSMSKHERP